MILSEQQTEYIRAVVEKLHDEPVQELRLRVRSLRGGLESCGVTHVSASYRDAGERSRNLGFVIKGLDAANTREASVYASFSPLTFGGFTPRLLGVEQDPLGRSLLFLEAIRPVNRWPWRQRATSASVLQVLATLHTTPPSSAAPPFPEWDYEALLADCAARTLDFTEMMRGNPRFSPLTRTLPALRRLVAALPDLRGLLLGHASFGKTFIHGDMHPGNVLVRRRQGRDEPVLLDWGRARSGSPLEDVSSWLQSLAYWEPDTRRGHDSLLIAYLEARGMEPRITSDIRVAYWIAAACNALSGALIHHLVGACEDGPNAAKSVACARDWLRIIRRADESASLPLVRTKAASWGSDRELTALEQEELSAGAPQPTCVGDVMSWDAVLPTPSGRRPQGAR